MKNYLAIILFFLAFNVVAQTPALPKLDEKAIVRDRSGNVLPYLLWRAYYKTGDYAFKFSADKTEFLIYEMTDAQKAKETERKQAGFATSARPMLSGAFKDGDKFKGDKFTDINGNKYDLRELSGKVLVFNFWFINCPPCKQEIPELNQLHNKYKENKDVIFLAIALDEKYQIKEFLKTNPFNYNIVADGKYYSQKYNVSSYPTHLIVGKDGLVKFHTTGLASNTVYWIEKTIKEQLAEVI